MIPAELIARELRFDAIFVDEAGQCSEPELLTPLRFAYSGYSLRANTHRESLSANCLRLPIRGEPSIPPSAVSKACSRLILVGDPLQVRQVVDGA